MLPLVALWALGALSALIYSLTALRLAFGGAAA